MTPVVPPSEIAIDPVLTPAEERARLDIQLAELDRLSEAGLDMARALADQAKGTGPEVFKGDMALAYTRISRAVRMAILIQSRLMNDIQGRQKMAIEAEVDRDNTRFNREQRRKGAVEDIVARICRADPEGYEEDEIDDRVREAGEYLDDDELYGDVLTRPISELVAQVCQDLGLPVDWPAQAQQHWAQREMQSGEVGTPLTPYLSHLRQSTADGASPVATNDLLAMQTRAACRPEAAAQRVMDGAGGLDDLAAASRSDSS